MFLILSIMHLKGIRLITWKNDFPTMQQKRYGPDIGDMDNICLKHRFVPLWTWRTALHQSLCPFSPAAETVDASIWVVSTDVLM